MAASFYDSISSDMLRDHLMGTKLMRRHPWPLALPARKHRCSRPILRPWHGRYHDEKIRYWANQFWYCFIDTS